MPGDNTRDLNKAVFWIREDRNGNKYMSGKVTMPDGTSYQLNVFRNTFKKEGENTPDYRGELKGPAGLTMQHVPSGEVRTPSPPSHAQRPGALPARNDGPFDAPPPASDDMPF